MGFINESIKLRYYRCQSKLICERIGHISRKTTVGSFMW